MAYRGVAEDAEGESEMRNLCVLCASAVSFLLLVTSTQDVLRR